MSNKTLHEDPYVRLSTRFNRAEVSMRDEAKLTPAAERLHISLMKEMQNNIFSSTLKELFNERAMKILPNIADSYKDSYVKHLTKQEKMSKVKKSENAVSEIVQKKLKKDVELLNRLAYKEAWKIVMHKELSIKQFTYTFAANEIIDIANISKGNYGLIKQNFERVRQKEHKWNELIFDEKSGSFKNMEYIAPLFIKTGYERVGRGKNGIVEVTLNPELAHMIVFINERFVKIHHNSYLKLKTVNSQRLFSLIVDYSEASSSLPKKNATLNIEEMQKEHFKSKYKKLSEFIYQVLKPALKVINGVLGCHISMKRVKIENVNVGLEFVITPDDRAILMGVKNVDLDENENLISSFGYYLALKKYGNSCTEVSLLKKAQENEKNLEESTYDFEKEDDEIKLYNEFIEESDFIHKINVLIEEEKGLLYGRYYVSNQEYIIYSVDGNTQIGGSLKDGYKYLKDLVAKSSKITIQHSLPGMLQPTDGHKMNIHFPFIFKPTPSNVVIVNLDNYQTYDRRIATAIRMRRSESFEFISKEKGLSFFNDVYMGAFDGVVKTSKKLKLIEPVEADVIEATIIDNRDEEVITHPFIDILRRYNSEFASDNIEEWIAVINELKSNSSNKNIFDNVLLDVGKWLTEDKNSFKYYIAHLHAPSKLKIKWPVYTQKASLWFNKSNSQFNGMDIFDYYEGL